MRQALLLLHGWGCAPDMWDGLLGCLPDWPALRWDRGYFGSSIMAPLPDAPFIAIGHSLGGLLLAHLLPPDIPLVVINGFDRFTGKDAVPPRVIDRMRRRFAEAPAAVLADFHVRCGTSAPAGTINENALTEDLWILASLEVPSQRRPMLVLQGERDPLLPASLRESVFPGAMRETHAGAGHALPLSHPEWCADRIEGFAWA